MKFIKGMMLGGLLSVGFTMMYADKMQSNRKKAIKMGRQFVKKMGII